MIIRPNNHHSLTRQISFWPCSVNQIRMFGMTGPLSLAREGSRDAP
jgi:hypothetical protein